jgi:hypothetical protein
MFQKVDRRRGIEVGDGVGLEEPVADDARTPDREAVNAMDELPQPFEEPAGNARDAISFRCPCSLMEPPGPATVVLAVVLSGLSFTSLSVAGDWWAYWRNKLLGGSGGRGAHRRQSWPEMRSQSSCADLLLTEQGLSRRQKVGKILWLRCWVVGFFGCE